MKRDEEKTIILPNWKIQPQEIVILLCPFKEYAFTIEKCVLGAGGGFAGQI